MVNGGSLSPLTNKPCTPTRRYTIDSRGPSGDASQPKISAIAWPTRTQSSPCARPSSPLPRPDGAARVDRLPIRQGPSRETGGSGAFFSMTFTSARHRRSNLLTRQLLLALVSVAESASPTVRRFLHIDAALVLRPLTLSAGRHGTNASPPRRNHLLVSLAQRQAHRHGGRGERGVLSRARACAATSLG